MSKSNRYNPRRPQKGRNRPQRRIIVHSQRREPPDLRKLSRAVIALALAEMEAEQAAQAKNDVSEQAPSVPDAAGTPPDEADHA